MLDTGIVENICRTAIVEDIGSGDATTVAVVPEELTAEALIKAKEDCCCAGLLVAAQVFKELDPNAAFLYDVEDGDKCPAGTTMARVKGKARAILTGERTALNFLQRLSGIATLTSKYAAAVGAYSTTKILDTRKTTPGMRVLEKHAVKMGGGENHRFGLYDRVMIKDNHRLVAGLEGPDAIQRAVKSAREMYPALEVEVETDTLDEVSQAADAGADYILLDNMEDEEVREAVDIVEGRSVVEASGGINLERIPALAQTGVDYISAGALTHSAPATDIGLDLKL